MRVEEREEIMTAKVMMGMMMLMQTMTTIMMVTNSKMKPRYAELTCCRGRPNKPFLF